MSFSSPSTRTLTSSLLSLRTIALGCLAIAFTIALGCLAIAFVVSPVSADTPVKKFGRLFDGRAYRVDSSGFRLVDQVAELEVTVDELRRQLVAAQNESTFQARTIKRLSNGLSNGGSAAGDSVIEEKSLIKSAKLSKATQADSPNCNELVSGLYLRVSTLENDLRTARLNSQSVFAKAACPATTSALAQACDYDSEKNPLWAQVQRLQKELMSGPSKERVASQSKSLGRATNDLRTVQSQLSVQEVEADSLKDKLAETSEELDTANEKLESAKDQLARLGTELAETREDSEKINSRSNSRSGLKRAQPAPRRRANKSVNQVATASTPVARKLQQRFGQQLQQIQSLILKRKDLLDAKEARGGSYRTQPLMTANGMSLDTLRRGVAELSWSSNSATIEDGLKEIVTLLRKDIRNLSS